MIIATRAGEVDPGPRVDAGPETAPLSWLWSAPWLDRGWALTDLTSPVLKLKGATGTGQADPVHYWSEGGTLNGSAHNGFRTGRGSVFLPLVVLAGDTAEFLDHHSQFMQSLDPAHEGFLRVTRPDGQWRQIACRYESGADMAIELDPVMACRATYGITWAAGNPFWQGEEVVYRFANDAVAAFFPGPPFTLTSGLSVSDADVFNPGDVESFPIWRIEGPFTGFTVGIGGSEVSMTLTRTAGQWVEIDMRRGFKTYRDQAGVDVSSSVTAVEHKAIPAGSTQLTTGLAGESAATVVQVRFTPLYRRAW